MKRLLHRAYRLSCLWSSPLHERSRLPALRGSPPASGPVEAHARGDRAGAHRGGGAGVQPHPRLWPEPYRRHRRRHRLDDKRDVHDPGCDDGRDHHRRDDDIDGRDRNRDVDGRRRLGADVDRLAASGEPAAMAPLAVCASCGCHSFACEASCPHCGASCGTKSIRKRTLAAALLGLGLSLIHI